MNRSRDIFKRGCVIKHPKLGNSLYIVGDFKEKMPAMTIGNRTSRYENTITLKNSKSVRTSF